MGPQNSENCIKLNRKWAIGPLFGPILILSKKYPWCWALSIFKPLPSDSDLQLTGVFGDSKFYMQIHQKGFLFVVEQKKALCFTQLGKGGGVMLIFHYFNEIYISDIICRLSKKFPEPVRQMINMHMHLKFHYFLLDRQFFVCLVRHCIWLQRLVGKKVKQLHYSFHVHILLLYCSFFIHSHSPGKFILKYMYVHVHDVYPEQCT